jgi:hypothetical protein
MVSMTAISIAMNKKWGSTLSQWNRRNYGDRLLNEGLLGPWIRGRKKSAHDALETHLSCENIVTSLQKIQRNIDRRIMMSRIDEILAFNEKFVKKGMNHIKQGIYLGKSLLLFLVWIHGLSSYYPKL